MGKICKLYLNTTKYGIKDVDISLDALQMQLKK